MYQKAKALRSTVVGNFADARSKLGAVLAKAPADAAALVYLGWTELAAGDPAAADKAFSRALAAEAKRAAALYGDGWPRSASATGSRRTICTRGRSRALRCTSVRPWAWRAPIPSPGRRATRHRRRWPS